MYYENYIMAAQSFQWKKLFSWFAGVFQLTAHVHSVLLWTHQLVPLTLHQDDITYETMGFTGFLKSSNY